MIMVLKWITELWPFLAFSACCCQSACDVPLWPSHLCFILDLLILWGETLRPHLRPRVLQRCTMVPLRLVLLVLVLDTWRLSLWEVRGLIRFHTIVAFYQAILSVAQGVRVYTANLWHVVVVGLCSIFGALSLIIKRARSIS